MAGKPGNPIEIADPFARRLVGQYLERRNSDIENLQAAVKNADFETVRITGHNLSGSGAAYGLDNISWIGTKLESAAEDADGLRIKQLIAELKSYLGSLKVC